MARLIQQFDVLVSCPSDLQDIVGDVNQTVERFNETYSSYLGIQIKARHWTTDSYPKSGGRPQGLLNEILVDSCDAAIAVFWTKFGTPTGEFGSGTEEEIEMMLQGNKQVFLYFAEMDVPYGMSIDPRVKEFKDNYSEKGLYWTFKNKADFREMLFAHLSQHFLNPRVSSENSGLLRSELKVSGIAAGVATSNVKLEEFSFLGHPSGDEMLHAMDEIAYRIKAIQLPRKPSLIGSPYTAALSGNRVSFDEKTKQLVIQFCQKRSIETDNSFFDLGNLRDGILQVNPFGRSLDGTDEEIEKYNLIIKLQDAIYDYLRWTKYVSFFSGAKCLRLALVNDGQAPDRNIDVLIRIPKKEYIDPFSFEQPSDWVNDYISYKCNLNELFSNPTGPCLYQYPSSTMVTPIPLKNQVDTFSQEDENEYLNELAQVLGYEAHTDEDAVILAVHFPSIKQHTGIVFPSPIFVREFLETIEYEITAENSPEVIKGSILIGRGANNVEE